MPESNFVCRHAAEGGVDRRRRGGACGLLESVHAAREGGLPGVGEIGEGVKLGAMQNIFQLVRTDGRVFYQPLVEAEAPRIALVFALRIESIARRIEYIAHQTR